MTTPGAAPTPRFVDLQTHTTAPDGVLSPTAVVEAAARVNLSAIAITDHDSISGVAEAERAGARLGVRIVTGVELSAHFDGDEYHLLGLHIADRARIERDLEIFREERIERARRMVGVLNTHDMPITLDAVLEQAGPGAVGRPHVARALMAGGWVRDFRDAFDRWLGWGKPAYVEKVELTVVQAIELLHACGGLAVWAHPGDLATETRLGKLKGLGLDAVEVLHPSHPQALAERIYERAEKLDLLPSGGSDWHGAAEGPRQLGGQLVPFVWLARQDTAIAERRG
jgi:3',5'-nucleoside bisphosphate phosphatase